MNVQKHNLMFLLARLESVYSLIWGQGGGEH